MNCKEAIDLAEEAMDKDLPRAIKRRLDLHLSRCESCRRLFEAERAEHVRWFRIFNDPAAMRSLPPGFADRLAASVRSARPGFWFRIPRWLKRAACLLALASFVSFAAVVGLHVTETANQDEAANHDVLANQDAAANPDEAAESDTSDTSVTSELPESPSQVSPVLQVTQVPQLTPKGEETMTGKKATAVALTAALAASAPLGAAKGDGYQFIISGELVSETTGCSSGDSSTAALTGVRLAGGVVYASELEARYRTIDESAAHSLRSDKSGITISIR